MCERGTSMQLFGVMYLIVVAGYSCAERNTLFRGQELKDGEHLVSTYGKFRLGFLQSQYLGIWYSIPSGAESWFYGDKSNQRYQKLVWVATLVPIWDKSGILSIRADGNLKIDRSGGDPIVFTSARVGSSNTSATLHDDGNFVLNELNEDGSVRRLLWQTFDYPTDTFLPGMKLGVNMRTGHRWFLTSWQQGKVLAPGSFTFGMDPNGTKKLTVLWEREAYWHSGSWMDDAFSLSNELSSKFHFQYIENENETYFTYYVYRDDPLSFPAIVIDNFGSLSGFTDSMVSCCDFCGQVSPGCVPEAVPSCRKKLDQFSRAASTTTPFFIELSWGGGFETGHAPDRIHVKHNSTHQLCYNDCRQICLRNCSCAGYAFYLNESLSGCATWSLNITRASLGGKQAFWRNTFSWFIIAVGGALLLVLPLSCFAIWRFKLHELVLNQVGEHLLTLLGLAFMMFRNFRRLGAQLLQLLGKTNSEQEILLSELETGVIDDRWHAKKFQELQSFTLASVAAATDNFSAANKLGEGGFGPVYKGKLPDGQDIAVKRLSTSSKQGSVEFMNEVKVIAKLQHNNLVSLIGCCLEKEEKILIYEYMPNKNLDYFLFDPRNQHKLDWRRRFNIVEGIAQGLLYLHKFSGLKIIHRDLKASNILLDLEMNPKISDFGMARIFSPEESKANTDRVVGTYGYMPPEYAIEGIFSTKSDVYSFGVLLLEIVSGRRNNSFHHSDGPLSLIIHAWELWRHGRVFELIDQEASGASQNEMMQCIHIGLLCVQESAPDRPNMLDVVSMLYNEASELPRPNQPAFYYGRNLQGLEILGNKQDEHGSLNDVTITEMDGR